MKHTLMNFISIYSRECIHANYPKNFPDKDLRFFSYNWILSLLLVLFSVNIYGQAPTTGTGASAILSYYTFAAGAPELTDPCTCAGTCPETGLEIFNDEIIIESPNPNEIWELIVGSVGVNQPNSCTAYVLDAAGLDGTITTRIPLTGIGTNPGGTATTYIYSLPISHVAGIGYSAIVELELTPSTTYAAGFTMSIGNTCSKVEVDFDLTGLPDTGCNGIGAGDGIPDITLTSSPSIPVQVFNQQSGTDISTTLNNPLVGGTLDAGDSASIYIGTASNKRKILVGQITGSGSSLVGGIPTDFDPSAALAIGCFNPLEDTLITYVFNAGASVQSQAYLNGALQVSGSAVSGLAFENNPGCEADVCAPINWDLCGSAIGDYHVGTSTSKYDGQRRVFTVCPCDPNKQYMKVAFNGRFDLAPDDTLTIYEGTDKNGTILEQSTSGGASAATTLSNTWFQASCQSDNGCLTVVFSPDSNDNNNGLGFEFLPTCETRAATVMCPSATTIPSACGINNSSSVAALYTIPLLTADCSYEPMVLSAVSIDTNNVAITLMDVNNLDDLDMNGEYFDANGNGDLDPGETVFLIMGMYDISYDYMDVDGTTQPCEYLLTVAEIAPVCNNQINISLNPNSCSALIAPDMLIEGDGCAGGYTINIMEGPDQGTNTISYANVGSTIKVEAVTPFGNRCWGLILVEDKAGPTFTCPDRAIYCGLSTDPTVSNLFPTDEDDCSLPISYQFSDVEQIPFGCSRQGIDFDTTGMLVRTWTAFDAGGMASEPCTQNIYLLKPNLDMVSNIIWPEDKTFYCQDASSDPDYTHPDHAGYPSIRIGLDTIPLSFTCYFGIEHNDIDFETDCEGTRKIHRTWSIMDWCGVGGLTVIQDQSPQIIKVLDTIPPTISGMPDTLLYVSEHGLCRANVTLPAITVTDQCSPTDATFRIIGPSSTIYNQGGTMTNVPFGTHTFTYIAEDGCGNQTRDSIQLTIKDNVAPTAIFESPTVSLNSATDITWVYASSFDGGSHDNCKIDSVLARIVDSGDPFSDAVGFTCSDIGTVMVELKVVDECGNANFVMGEVEITDKLNLCGCTNPLADAGPNVTTCAGTSVQLMATGGATYLWSPSQGLSNTMIANPVANPATTTKYYVTITDASNCPITDSLTVTVNALPLASAGSDVSICNGSSTTLSASGGTSYSWSPSTGLSNTSVANPITTPTTTTVYTVIVGDGNGCTASDNVTITVNSASVDAGADVGVCVGESIVLNAQGSTSGTYVWSPSISLSAANVANPTAFPLDTTTYSVTFTDGNGCTATDEIAVNVNSLPTANITVSESSGIASNDGILCSGSMATLTASGGSTYVWSNGATVSSINVSTPNMYTVTATDVNGCTGEFSTGITNHPDSKPRIIVELPLSINLSSQMHVELDGSTNTTIQSVLWDQNTHFSSGTVTDDTVTLSPNATGTVTYVVTITDNNNCQSQTTTGPLSIGTTSSPTPMAALSGKIHTELGEHVEQTTINLAGYDMPPTLTGATGNYEFDEVPMYDNYTVTPQKNINPLNGVSTFDLVLMSKHILGINTLDSPYKLIAADINRSGTITAFDMVQLRKVILNIEPDFPNNTSWRFVDARYEFIDPANPLGEAIPETYEITDLDTDMTWLDFIAIKIGDLNDSARPNSFVQSENRNATETLWLSAEPTLNTEDETLVYHFTADNFQEIVGYQFTLEYDPTILEFDQVIPTEWIGVEHFGTTHSKKGLLTTSWNTAMAKDFSKEETLFSISFKLKGEVKKSDLLAINSNILQAEAYQEEEILEVQLQQELVIPEVATDKFELYQNRPNPFTGKTTIGFSLPEATTAIMRIISTDGRIIKMYENTYEQGYHELIIDSNDLTQHGALYYQLSTPTQIATKKMIYTK